MRAVNVGISHDNNFAVAAFGKVEVFANTGSKRGNHGTNFSVGKNFIETSFFDVENFSAQRQYRLKFPVASLFCTAARRIAFDDINFCLVGISYGTIGEFAG